MNSDRYIIKDEPQEFHKSSWILWRRRAFHQNGGFWICSKWNTLWAFTRWVPIT